MLTILIYVTYNKTKYDKITNDKKQYSFIQLFCRRQFKCRLAFYKNVLCQGIFLPARIISCNVVKFCVDK